MPNSDARLAPLSGGAVVLELGAESWVDEGSDSSCVVVVSMTVVGAVVAGLVVVELKKPVLLV